MDRAEYTVSLFTGSNGKKRINCAEAISRVYHMDIAPQTDSNLKHFKKCGHGKAPGKLCGAYYAGIKLLEEGNPDKVDQFKESFYSGAGSLICHEILKKKISTCEECVYIAAEYLSKL